MHSESPYYFPNCKVGPAKGLRHNRLAFKVVAILKIKLHLKRKNKEKEWQKRRAVHFQFYQSLALLFNDISIAIEMDSSYLWRIYDLLPASNYKLSFLASFDQR
jgi:hypothetical protein